MSLPFDIPTLQTARLTLRAPREADLPVITGFLTSPRSQHIGGPYTDAQVFSGFVGGIGHWALRGFGWWMLEDRATGAVVGRCGVSHWLHKMPEPELGWHIYDGFEGQGLAHEAAIAARDHAAKVWGLGPLISMINPENSRSLALAKRLGAWFESMGKIEGDICQIWRHPLESIT